MICFLQWGRDLVEPITFVSKVQIAWLKCIRCAQISSTIHLGSLEATKVTWDRQVPLCFEMYYDRPLYLTTNKFHINILFFFLARNKTLIAWEFRIHHIFLVILLLRKIISKLTTRKLQYENLHICTPKE
jgi:hypothetical protein